MNAQSSPAAGNKMLPVVLIAAVVQGWALYALHLAVKGNYWPATAPGVLLGLYAAAVFVPLTVQLLAEHARRPAMWVLAGLVGIFFFYVGWHHGVIMGPEKTRLFLSDDWLFPLPFVVAILWLMTLPFFQWRLTSGHWRVQYQALFSAAWRNKLMLAEAALFTLLFWFLLFLWQMLFHLLGISFFRELFQEPLFVYPTTSLVFGIALHLIGSLERLTNAILVQLLNVLKWLAILAGLIVALFTVALIFKLPGLVFEGEKAIGATWLLWLVAVMVLLINAAFRDGSVERPYPNWIALALRFVIPLIVVVATTAVYALCVRIAAYGFTLERVWALIVASAAFIYSVGYTIAAMREGRWMAGIASVNIFTALFLIAVIALTLTPVLSPYRISAKSQYAMALEPPKSQEPTNGRYITSSPLHYLRFNAGKYGQEKLRGLTKLENHPRAAQIRQGAQDMLAQTERWLPAFPMDSKEILAKMPVHPALRTLDAKLLEALNEEAKKSDMSWVYREKSHKPGGIFVDLDGDGVEEFVLGLGGTGYVYQLKSDRWRRVGTMTSQDGWSGSPISEEVAKGNVSVQEPVWKDLKIGKHTYRLYRTEAGSEAGASLSRSR